MKKTLLLFLLFPILANGQSYQLVFPGYENIFKDSSGLVVAIKIEGVQIQGSDSVFLPNKMVDRDSLKNHNSYPWLVNAADTSWVGHKIIKKADGLYIFNNSKNDSILIYSRAPLNYSWKFMSLINGNYLAANINNVGIENFSGVSDSIKELTIQAKNSSGTSIAHLLNGKKIKWSKTYGFINIPDFYYLPGYLIQYNLIGITSIPSTKNIPNSQTIFEYNVGDEFHYTGGYDAPTSGGINIKKKIIISKTINGNSVVYKDSIIEAENRYESNPVLQKYIITETINLNNAAFNDLPFQVRQIDGMGSITYLFDKNNFNGRIIKKIKAMDNSYYSDNILTIKWGCVNLNEKEYVEGLGKISDRTTGGCYLHQGNSSWEFLKYYKKGIETYGQALDYCDILVFKPTLAHLGDSLKFSSGDPYGNQAGKIEWHLDNHILRDTTAVLNLDKNGWYKVRYKRFDCTSVFSDSVLITNFCSLSADSTPVISMIGDTIFSNIPDNNIWFNDGEIINSLDTNNFIIVTKSGNYSSIIKINDCYSSFSNTIKVNKDTIPVGTNTTYINAAIAIHFNIYPNPNNGILYINSLDGKIYKVKVINGIGNEIFEGKMSEGKTEINLENGLPGIYYLQITDERKIIFTKKIFIEK
jgi:hypothetical protein